MNWNNNWNNGGGPGWGAPGWGGGMGAPPQGPPPPPGPPPGGGNGGIMQALAETQRQMAELISLQRTGKNWPEHFRAGVIKYPDRDPFPFVDSRELLDSDGNSYGITNAEVSASFSIDVNNPVFLKHVSFALYKPVVDGNTGRTGIWLPLGGTRDPFPTAANAYIGRDFQWRMKSSSNDLLYQDGWRTSDSANGDDRKGYELTIELELRRNDTLEIKVQPIGAVDDPAQTYRLYVQLHVYKMLLVE